jgi:drug/metabolite transporter (DMT)-like permease
VTDPRLLIPALLLVDSLYYVFARISAAYLPPAAGAMYMMVLGALEIAVLMRGRIDWRVLAAHRWLFLAIGLLVGVNTNMGFAVIRYVDPGTASVLSRTSILFGVGLGVLWLRERLTRVEVLGATIAVAGTVVVSFQPGDYFRWGALVIILSTLLYAVHSALAKRWGGSIPLAEFLLFRVSATAAVLVVLTAAQGQLLWPELSVLGLLAAMAFVNILVSRGLYYLALRRRDMSLLTIVLTLTPVVTWLWSMPLFGGRPTGQEIAGGVAVLVGVLVVTVSRARRPIL